MYVVFYRGNALKSLRHGRLLEAAYLFGFNLYEYARYRKVGVEYTHCGLQILEHEYSLTWYGFLCYRVKDVLPIVERHVYLYTGDGRRLVNNLIEYKRDAYVSLYSLIMAMLLSLYPRLQDVVVRYDLPKGHTCSSLLGMSIGVLSRYAVTPQELFETLKSVDLIYGYR